MFAAKRLVSDLQRREYKQDAVEQGKQIMALKDANRLANDALTESERKFALVVDDNIRISKQLEAAEDRVNKLKPWALFGKISLGAGIAVGVIAGIGAIHGE